MSSSLKWWLLTLSVVAPSAAQAAAPGSVTVEAAIARVIAEHPSSRASVHATQSAVATADKAEALWLPKIELEAWYRVNGPVPTLRMDTGIVLPGETESLAFTQHLGALHNGGAAVSVAWRALDFGVRDAHEAGAQAAIRAAHAQGAERAVELAFATRSAYLSSLYFKALTEATRRALDAANTGLTDARNRQDAGLTGALGVASNESRVADLQARLAGVVEAEARMRVTLNLLLGLPQDSALNLSDSLEGLAELPAGAEDDTVDPSQHPTLVRLDAVGESLEAGEVAASNRTRPTLDLFARAAVQFPWTIVNVDEVGVVATAGVSFKWSVLNAGLDSESRAIAEHGAEVRALREAASREVARALAEAQSKRASALAQAVASERQVASAQIYVDVANSARAAGTGTSLDVLNAEVALDRANTAMVKAHFDAALAEALRLRALGRVHGGVAQSTSPSNSAGGQK